MSKYPLPRLVEKFGKSHSLKMILHPTDVNERSHVILGECSSKNRETYFRSWKRCLKDRIRLKPERASSLNDPVVQETIGSSFSEPQLALLCKKVAENLRNLRTPQLSELINVGEIIGSGVEGVVRPGQKKICSEKGLFFETISEKMGNKKLAVKTVEKNAKTRTALDCREVKVLSELSSFNHPNLTNYVHTFESPVRFHIVSEYNQGGDLFSYLQSHDFERLAEERAARTFMQACCGVLFTHEHGFAHLDLKLENIMRKEAGEEIDSGGVCLIDFGHASKILPNHELCNLPAPVGSPSYAAPEIVLNKQFSDKSDAWSLGVVLYILLQGYLPFPHLQQKKWREFSINDYGNFDKKIVENDPFYFQGDWEEISASAKDLCQKLLQVDINKRISVSEAVTHPWFKENGIRMKRDENSLPLLDFISESAKVSSSASTIVGEKKMFGIV